MSTLALVRSLPPLMQLGMCVPLSIYMGIHMGIQHSRETALPPNGVQKGFLYVVAAHDYGTVKFWSFATAEAAWNFFHNGVMLRRVIVRRTGPVDYDELSRAGPANWVDGDIFREINYRIGPSYTPLMGQDPHILA
jgi:hypothetical protein